MNDTPLYAHSGLVRRSRRSPGFASAIVLALLLGLAGCAYGPAESGSIAEPETPALSADAGVGSSEPRRILTASSVRVRSAPNTSAKIVGEVGLGTVVTELERSSAQEKIGESEDYWYRVRLPNGTEGWLFGAFTKAVDPAAGERTYVEVVTARMDGRELAFAEWVDLTEFLERTVHGLKDPAVQGELDLYRLLALQESLATIAAGEDRKAPYKDWLDRHTSTIVYSEPAGQWYVRADEFWKLEEKFRGQEISDRIAWEASQAPLPGECEGYPPCGVNLVAGQEARYLERYPQGSFSVHAVDQIVENMSYLTTSDADAIWDADIPAEDLREMIADLERIRAAVEKTKLPTTARALAEIDKAIARYDR